MSRPVKWTKADSRRAWQAVVGFRLTHGTVGPHGLEMAEIREGADIETAECFAACYELEVYASIQSGYERKYLDSIKHYESKGWPVPPGFIGAAPKAKRKAALYRRLIAKIQEHGMPPKLED